MKLLTFIRSYANEKVLVVANLSDAVRLANISAGQDQLLTQTTDLICRNKKPDNKSDILSFKLKPYAIKIWHIE